MNKMEKLASLKDNVFTIQDLGVIWNISDRKKLLEIIKYYNRTGSLSSLKRGIYTTKKEYNNFELAQKIIPLSYISFYTALATHGVIFQYYDTIHCISLKSKKVQIQKQKFDFHQFKPDIFFNSLGIEKKETYAIATSERAICDSLYLKPNLAFDNLTGVDKKKLVEISKIYDNKRLEKTVQKLMIK